MFIAKKLGETTSISEQLPPHPPHFPHILPGLTPKSQQTRPGRGRYQGFLKDPCICSKYSSIHRLAIPEGPLPRFPRSRSPHCVRVGVPRANHRLQRPRDFQGPWAGRFRECKLCGFRDCQDAEFPHNSLRRGAQLVRAVRRPRARSTQ